MKIRKYEKKLTPSGMWDNSLWVLSENTVEFPDSKVKEAIVETVKLKKGSGYGQNYREIRYFDAFIVTIDGNRWYVEVDPRG